jgi:hypothetical protein
MGNALSRLSDAYARFWARSFGLSVDAEFGVVGAGSILRCAVLSFLAYWAPLALLRRKLRDPFHLRSALAFGAFSGTYRTVRLLVALHAAATNQPQLNRSAPFFAGAVGAMVGAYVDPSFLSSLFVLWWCMRAARTLPGVEEFQDSKYGVAAVMCLAADQLAPVSVYSPQVCGLEFAAGLPSS